MTVCNNVFRFLWKKNRCRYIGMESYNCIVASVFIYIYILYIHIYARQWPTFSKIILVKPYNGSPLLIGLFFQYTFITRKIVLSLRGQLVMSDTRMALYTVIVGCRYGIEQVHYMCVRSVTFFFPFTTDAFLFRYNLTFIIINNTVNSYLKEINFGYIQIMLIFMSKIN